MGYGRQTGDYKEFGAPFVIPLPAITTTGTAAGDTAIASTIFGVPFACKFVGGTRYVSTGGTAASFSVALQQSLAGTGTFTSIGTAVIGTNATAAAVNMTTLSTNTIAAGDQIRLAVLSGTVAGTQVGTFLLSFVEVFA